MRKQVLIVSHLYPRPAAAAYGQFVRDQVRFIAHRYDVTVVTSHPVFPPIRFFGRWYERSRPVPDPGDPNVRVVSIPCAMVPRSQLRWLRRATHAAGVALAVDSIGRSRSIDLIHAHCLYPDGLSALLGSRLIDVPLVVTVHGSDAFLDHGWFLDRLPNKLVLAKADLVIAVSTSVHGSLQQRYGRIPQLRIIENGVPLDRFRVRAKEQCAGLCGLDPARPRAIAVGAIDEVKGTDVLLLAWRRVLEVLKDAELVLVGSPLEVRHARWANHQIDRLGIGSSVRLVGQQSNEIVPNFVGASDVLVSASRREGFGMTIVEALACGRPVVATRSGGPNDIVTPDLGILVPVEDPVSLADVIIKVLKGEARFDPQHLAGEARRRFDLNDRVKTILALYDDVLKRHKRLDTR